MSFREAAKEARSLRGVCRRPDRNLLSDEGVIITPHIYGVSKTQAHFDAEVSLGKSWPENVRRQVKGLLVVTVPAKPGPTNYRGRLITASTNARDSLRVEAGGFGYPFAMVEALTRSGSFRFVWKPRVFDWKARWDECVADLEKIKDEMLESYPAIRLTMVDVMRELTRDAEERLRRLGQEVPPDYLDQVIQANMASVPSPADIGSMRFEYSVFPIPSLNLPGTETLVSSNGNSDLAAEFIGKLKSESIRKIVEETLDPIADALESLRAYIYQECQSIAETLENGQMPKATAAKMLKIVSQFKAMNLADDREMAVLIEELGRVAEEVRALPTAPPTKTIAEAWKGVSIIRDTAQETLLAAQKRGRFANLRFE